jgi:pyrroline-5-carboxylate reductase
LLILLDKVSIIGSGNVAQHLISAFYRFKIEFKIELVKLTPEKRNHYQLLDNSQICTDIQQLKEADLYIMAVSDDGISFRTINL